MVYEIKKYNMIGQILYTKKERPDLYCKNNKYFYIDTIIPAFISNLWEFTTELDEKITYFDANDEFLPYFADVTEDIPEWSKKVYTPKTYSNCQLMTEKHGGYYQFKDKTSGDVLRIAFNSHIYSPSKI
jgi:hypothetical protein